MPGSRHAKNNTALGYFTRHEREASGWGSKKRRLTKDSIKKFYACTICLKLCDQPLVCPHGDLFCKECIYHSLLTQKRKNKQQLTEYQQQQDEYQQKLQTQKRQHAVDKFLQFDRLQNIAPSAASTVPSNHSSTPQQTSSAVLNTGTPVTSTSSNVLNADLTKNHNHTHNVLAASNGSKDLAMQPDTNERGKKLSCFWIPSLTPDAGPKLLRAPDMNTYCPGCNKPLKLKQLVSCRFTLTTHDHNDVLASTAKEDEELDDKEKEKRKRKRKKKRKEEEERANHHKRNADTKSLISDTMSISADNLNKDDHLYECGSCGKILTNAIRSACLSKCGHILCLECIKKFVAKNKCCVVCDEPCKKKHVIVLSSGGTGFAAHGDKIEATQKAVAFQ